MSTYRNGVEPLLLLFLCLTGLFSRDYSRLSQVRHRSSKQPLMISDARSFTGRMPFLSSNQKSKHGRNGVQRCSKLIITLAKEGIFYLALVSVCLSVW